MDSEPTKTRNPNYGGKRKGAGRPPLQPNKYSSVRAERARSTGQMPSEAMLEMARAIKGTMAAYQPKIVDAKDKDGNDIRAIDWPDDKRKTFLELAEKAGDLFAKCAPYMEQRMAQVHELRRVDLTRLSDRELDAFEELVTKAADEDGISDRASATLQ